MKRKTVWNAPAQRRQTGFSLLETMISLVVLLAVSGIVMSGMVQLMKTQGTIANRTEMHASVRSATELLQQEIGQAGRISLPNPGVPVTLTTPVAAPGTLVTSVSSAAGMFVGEQLVIDAGSNQEMVALTSVSPIGNTITATFANAHAAGAAVTVQGGFAAGIVPDSIPGGSSPTVLKLFGDINSDGNMVFVEYTCDTANGFLYRNEVAFDAAVLPALDPSKILLTNVLPNPPQPNGTAVPCFSYQKASVTLGVTTYTFVTQVAVTLTEQTQNPDPQTGQFQNETKALLNVSPRNVFDAWEEASVGVVSRVQPMPPSVGPGSGSLITQ